MKREGGRPPVIALVAALFCVVVAVGAGLQGRLNFAGPLWTPGAPKPPPVRNTPPPTGHPNATPPPVAPAANTGVIFNWVPIIIVLAILSAAVIVSLIWLWRRHRPKRGIAVDLLSEMSVGDFATQQETQPDLPTLQRGLARATDILETDREPRDAIVRAWVGLQEAAEDSGVRRRAAETPTEFTSRVFSSVRADREAADALLAIYLRVRFGTSPATPDDVTGARDAVARLSATWPIGAPE
ncbi:MAG: hypothetical protein QOE85_1337 [Actinomycetota bacterium]|nr:hypothetical protein [Actinomycetota bacterium]MDQ1561996.1 hypothetical protein [Actinomycetota bacterium]